MPDLEDAIAAWALEGSPAPIESLTGGVVRVGGAVLKPAADPVEAEWCAQLLDALPERGFRLARPLRTRDGRWVAHGFTAWRWVPGEPARDGQWAEVLAAAAALHAALEGVACPDFFARRAHRWAVADRVAWGEAELPFIPELARPVARLQGRLRPVKARPQIIHGDLTGNTLLAPGLLPAIIDFSPYWRPAEYAAAIVVVDAMMWHRAQPDLMEDAAAGPDWVQHLARAWLFRMLSLSQYIASVDGSAVEEVPPALAVAAEIERRL